MGANVTVLGINKSLTTDDKGSVLFELPEGYHDVRLSYVGFYTTTKKVELLANMRFNVQ
ncbi:MAG: carboxypeptidase-like regulatory domain-containing protein [Saprospiraceae bacterium]|nr:carboxypeptidase-like regulatory domain-containing protein [Saprospiraceae bacterium]